MSCIKEISFSPGDTLPTIQLQAISSSTGLPVDLVISSVKFKMTDQSGTVVIDSDAVIVNQTDKIVGYTFSSNDTDVPGEYYGKFVVTFSGTGGGVRSFPTGNGIKIIIEEF